jgi:hypothetical protein
VSQSEGPLVLLQRGALIETSISRSWRHWAAKSVGTEEEVGLNNFRGLQCNHRRVGILSSGGNLLAPMPPGRSRATPSRTLPIFGRLCRSALVSIMSSPILLCHASGASVDQVDCLVRADIKIGHIRRLTVGVFPAQIHVTILAQRYFSPRPLAGFQRA